MNLFGNFSAMSISLNYNVHNSSSGSTIIGGSNSSYKVLYSPKTGSSAYKAMFSYNATSNSKSGTVWIQPDGVVIATYTNGQNFTGPQAFSIASGLLTYPFPLEYLYSTNTLFQGPGNPHFHQINTTSVTLGPTTFTVANYGLNSQYTQCLQNGFYTSVSSGLIQQGTIPGTKMLLITYNQGTSEFHANGGTLSSMGTFRITSVTKA